LSATRERAALLAVTLSDLNTDRWRVQPAVPLTSPTKTADRRLAVNHTCPFNRPVSSTETSRCCRPLSTYVSVSSFGSSKKIYRTTLCNWKAFRSDVAYARTVKRNDNCSVVNLEGRGKIVLTCTFAIHLFFYERRYNILLLKRRRYGLSTLSRETRRVRLSADAVARERTLTTRPSHRAGVPRCCLYRPSSEIALNRWTSPLPACSAGYSNITN